MWSVKNDYELYPVRKFDRNHGIEDSLIAKLNLSVFVTVLSVAVNIRSCWRKTHCK
jgi:hypothetical protein